MNINEVVLSLKSYFQSDLDSLKEKILRCCQEGKNYQTIALETQYKEEEVKAAASNLWMILSNVTKQVIEKSNFRSSFETFNLSHFESDLFQLSATSRNEDVALEFPNGRSRRTYWL